LPAQALSNALIASELPETLVQSVDVESSGIAGAEFGLSFVPLRLVGPRVGTAAQAVAPGQLVHHVVDELDRARALYNRALSPIVEEVTAV
jgi:hypothetical protein